MERANPYDELPYRSLPIEWSAPERLALASLLQGGPRPPSSACRVLELGCGDGANLLALAYYRRDAEFVGLDGAGSCIAAARRRQAALGIANVALIDADFMDADAGLAGRFDYILAHGVFSWVDAARREALLALFAARLRPGGLVYVNYNAFPGWKVRGLVRDHLRAATDAGLPRAGRVAQAQVLAARVIEAMEVDAHPWRALVRDEYRLVCEGHPSYVSHEYLADENQAFWASEFLASLRPYGLEYVAEADFAYPASRTPEGLATQLCHAGLVGKSIDDTVDLLCFRQIRSALLTVDAPPRRALDADEFAALRIASCLERARVEEAAVVYLHPSGVEVEARHPALDAALRRLQDAWPCSLRVDEAFNDPCRFVDDVRLLHRNGLVELRLMEVGEGVDPTLLHRVERDAGGYRTSRHHAVQTVAD